MEYRKEIRVAINYIEQRLDREIRTDDVADAAGFSKYHFQRIFKNETGLALCEYIRKRRLARAASFLLNSNMNVMTIAMSLCFESQESFTRAFKKCYGLPPGQYRKALRNLMNGGNDMELEKNKKIRHWIITGTAPDKY